jgi:pilus assembly protein CpaC
VWEPPPRPSLEAQRKAQDLIGQWVGTDLTLDLDPRHSKILRTKKPVARISITNPDVLEVTQFSPTEFELIGARTGQTNFTLWFAEPGGQGPGEMLRYMVRVYPDQSAEEQQTIEYGELERRINELFPNSSVHLIPIADKLIVRGEAHDSREAAEIMGILRSESGQVKAAGAAATGAAAPGGAGFGGVLPGAVNPQSGLAATPEGGPPVRLGAAVNLFPGRPARPVNLINMLDVPGEMQVMLKVRVAELSRSALRNIGSQMNLNFGNFALNSNFGLGSAFNAVLTTKDVMLTIDAIASNSYGKVLAEPNLVTLSGNSASFIAGGQFAVPTAVGVNGIGAVSTNFQGFGAQLQFTPTVIDKDRIRLQVAPTFSTLDQANAVNGIPGLDTRAVTTTVELREGQWLAIAGLIQDQLQGSKAGVPWLSDLPYISFLFSNRHIQRDETELLVLVSPELVHPLEPEEAPLVLPGMELTEPGNWAEYLVGDYEGRIGCEHRGTTAPIDQQHLREARIDARREARYQRSEDRYLEGPHGFSQ